MEIYFYTLSEHANLYEYRIRLQGGYYQSNVLRLLLLVIRTPVSRTFFLIRLLFNRL